MGRHSSKKWDGPTIREMRAHLGLSQTQFSKKFGVPLRTIVSWEASEKESPTISSRPCPYHVYKLLNIIIYECGGNVLDNNASTDVIVLPFVEIRRLFHHTQASLSEYLGCSKRTIELWEASDRMASYHHQPASYIKPLLYWALCGHPYGE